MPTNEAANRIAKAGRILGLLDSADSTAITGEQVRNLTDGTWSVVAALTGGRPISDETIEVVAVLADTRSALPSNPFAAVSA